MHFLPPASPVEDLAPLFGPYMVESPTQPQPQSHDSWDIDSDMELALNRVWEDIKNRAAALPRADPWELDSEMGLSHNRAWIECKNEPPSPGPTRRRRNHRRSRLRKSKQTRRERAASYNPIRFPRPYSIDPWRIPDSVFKIARIPPPLRPSPWEYPSYETLPYPSEVAIRRPYLFNDDQHRPLPTLDDLEAIASWVEIIPTHLRHITLQELQWLQHQVDHYKIQTGWGHWYTDHKIREDWLNRDWTKWSCVKI